MDRAWPIISNKRVVAINQRWAGSPGRRVTLAPDDTWQAWCGKRLCLNHLNVKTILLPRHARDKHIGKVEGKEAFFRRAKPMGGTSYAVFVVNTAEIPVAVALPMKNVSAAFGEVGSLPRTTQSQITRKSVATHGASGDGVEEEHVVSSTATTADEAEAAAGVAVCARDLYTGKMLPTLKPHNQGSGAVLEATLPVHDSVFYCAWPSAADGSCDGVKNDCP